MLIDCGVNIGVFNKVSWNLCKCDKISLVYQNLYCPLHLAAKSGHLEVIETLVKAGADINAVNIKVATLTI